MGGIELTRRIKSSYPDIQVIVLTLHEDQAYFLQALQAGASGYVVKGSPSSDLLRALEAVGEGGTFLSPNLATGIVSTYLEDKREAAFQGLTSREREVAELLIEGSSNQEIALALNISATTVQTHRAHIFEKLELRSHTDLVRHAIRHGLIEP
jgi:two-component system response regulator NreC